MDRAPFTTKKGLSLKKRFIFALLTRRQFHECLDQALKEGGFTEEEEAGFKKVRNRVERNFYSTRLSFWFGYKRIDQAATSQAAEELRGRMLEHWSDDHCYVCGKPSTATEELLCCEGFGKFGAECNKVVHPSCVGLSEVPEGAWYHTEACKPEAAAARKRSASDDGGEAATKKQRLIAQDAQLSSSDEEGEDVPVVQQRVVKRKTPSHATPKNKPTARKPATSPMARPRAMPSELTEPRRPATVARSISRKSAPKTSPRPPVSWDVHPEEEDEDEGEDRFTFERHPPAYPIFKDPTLSNGIGLLRLALNEIVERRSLALRNVLNDIQILRCYAPHDPQVQDAYDKILALYNGPPSSFIEECSRIVKKIEFEEQCSDQEIAQLHAWVLQNTADAVRKR